MNNASKIHCPVCDQQSFLHDVVDLNKSCEEIRGKYLEISGTPIYYALCDHCEFCFAPEIAKWSLEDFEQKIYNQDYIEIDPDYVEARPTQNATMLHSTFGAHINIIKHLDYGGGSGLLSKLLNAQSWNSTSYDPFVDKDIAIEKVGKFDLITAFEVFEHVPDINILMKNLQTLLNPGGAIFFSTLLTDGFIKKHHRLGWWYASPRNGHISLFSKKSLEIVAKKYGFNFGSFGPGLHVLFNAVPSWAAHLIK